MPYLVCRFVTWFVTWLGVKGVELTGTEFVTRVPVNSTPLTLGE